MIAVKYTIFPITWVPLKIKRYIAIQVTTSGIKIWYWRLPKSSIPADFSRISLSKYSWKLILHFSRTHHFKWFDKTKNSSDLQILNQRANLDVNFKFEWYSFKKNQVKIIYLCHNNRLIRKCSIRCISTVFCGPGS